MISLTENSISILKSLLYYDVFKHPLKEDEIAVYTYQAVQHDLEYLSEQKLISKHKDFYFLGEDKSVIDKRIKGNRLARKYLDTTRTHAKWLSKVPFIKCLCISGSLSKNYMGQDSDVDYFIITEANRIWLVRALMTVIQKTLFVLRAKKYLCPNYMIASDNLEIQDKNIFTATELSTLIPLYNYSLYLELLEANKWMTSYVPNFKPAVPTPSISNPKNEKKSLRILKNADDLFYQVYRWHYTRKFSYAIKESEGAKKVILEKNCFKAHATPDHRNKILDKFDENVRKYETQYNINLNSQTVNH